MFTLFERWCSPSSGSINVRGYFAPTMYRTLVFTFVDMCFSTTLTDKQTQSRVEKVADFFMDNFEHIFKLDCSIPL